MIKKLTLTLMLLCFLITGCSGEAPPFEFEDGVITGYNGEVPEELVIPEEINEEAVTEIGDKAFVDEVKPVEGERTSYHIKSPGIKKIHIPDSVNRIGEYAFAGNYIEELTLNDMEEVSYGSFYESRKLSELNINAETIGGRAFENSNLAKVDFGESVNKIGQSSFAENNLAEVDLPDNITEIGVSSFEGNHIENIELSYGLSTIPERSFKNNIINDLVIPESVTIIKHSAFSSNELEEIKFSEGLEIIGGIPATDKGDGGAFEHNKLESIHLPSTLKEIQEQAFYGNDLTKIIINEDVKISPTSFLGNWANFENDYLGRAGKYKYNDDTGNWYFTEDYQKEEPQNPTAFLTFDDGPSNNTEEILEILADYNISATFFVTGNNTTGDPDIYSRIATQGHALGNHTYTHNFHEIYKSPSHFLEDFLRLHNLIKENTGIEMDIMRFPGGSSSGMAPEVANYNIIEEDLIPSMENQGYDYFDWNVSSGDGRADISSSEIVENSIRGAQREDGDIVVLFHDSGTKDTTVEALPEIIETYANMGYNFDSLSSGVVDVKHR